MSAALAALAAGAVVGGAHAWRSGRQWWAANRALARTGLRPASPRTVPAAIDRALDDAGIDVNHALAFHAWLGAIALALAAGVVTSGGPVLVAVVVVVPVVGVVASRGRAARQRIRQLPLALDAVAAGLRGGASLRAAIADAGTIGGRLGAELDLIASHAGAGRSLAEALGEWAHAAGDAPSRLAGAALVVAAELGGPGAAAVDAAAASLRERTAADDEVAALSVQARLSALLLTLAPIGFAFLLTSLDPTSARFLVGTPAGWACIAIGLGLDGAGALWMSRLVRGAR